MPFRDLQGFIAALERAGDLRRVSVEVDPRLEMTEIATRAVKEQAPAMLFERVKGSPYPVVMNTMATAKRIEMALGRPPQEIGHELVRFVERINPPSLKKLWELKGTARKLLAARAKPVGRGIAQEVVESPDLESLPVLTCWPEDGGRFITLPLVLTQSPGTGKRNLGIYRMQVFDKETTGMHWQIQKGGGFHYWEAEQRNEPLEVSVALGGDPALLLAAVLPLPEALEEIIFAGILRGGPTPMVRAKSLSMRVPANAEFVLEGVVPPHERRAEGPFGDHFGHYSAQAPFPVFHVKTVTRRRHPVYPATVVGKPPQEDRYLGDAVQEFLNPFVKMLRPEVRDLWAYFEAGFHNLLVVSVRTRYTKEPMKTALGLFGEGQLALTKCIVLVGPEVNPRDWTAVLKAIGRHFRPEHDFLLLPKVPLDTLDFTSFTMHLGSKMALDATPKGESQQVAPLRGVDISRLAPEVRAWRMVEETLLAVQVGSGEGKAVAERLARARELADVPLIAVVSEDIDLQDRTSLLWGIFTRFDPARDVTFREMRMEGAVPVYRGPLAIDATWKHGYPAPLTMDAAIVKRVEERWDSYWKQATR